MPAQGYVAPSSQSTFCSQVRGLRQGSQALSLGVMRVPEATSMHRASVLAASRGWTWSWGQRHVGQRHQASVGATAAAQPVSSSWPQHSQDISLAEAQLSWACGQMVAQCLHLAREITNRSQRNPTDSQTQLPNPSTSPSSPWRLGGQGWRVWLLQVFLGLCLPAGTHSLCHSLEHGLVQAQPV